MLTPVRKGLLLLLCGLAVTAPAASAQDDPVFVDPDSPSGKEYELPIDSARQQGAAKPQGQKSAGGAAKAPLFGEGVEGNGAGTTVREPAGKTADTDTPRASREKSPDAATGQAGQAAARVAAARKAQAAAPEGAGGLAAIIGVGIGVLALGGVVGLWLRRRAAA